MIVSGVGEVDEQVGEYVGCEGSVEQVGSGECVRSVDVVFDGDREAE